MIHEVLTGDQGPDGDVGGAVSEVSALLCSEDPDPRRMAEILREHGWRDGIDAFIYDTTVRVNRDVFPPLNKLELLLAEACDMACSYCFESAILDRTARRHRVMSDEVIRRAVDLLFDHSMAGQDVSITLFGGEPTINMRGVKTAIEHARARGEKQASAVSFHMTTNAFNLNQAMIDYLAANNVRMLLSVDGMQRSHDAYRKDRKGQGTWARVMENLRRIKQVQPWIGVKMTIMPSEAAGLFDNVRALYGEGVNQFVIGAATGVPWSADELDALAKNWRRLHQWIKLDAPENLRIADFEDVDAAEPPFFGCGAGRSTIAVNVAGEVSGCSRIISVEQDRTIGKLGDVWHGLYAIRDRLDMVSCSKLIGNCKEAGIADSYRGGCFATNYEETGDIYRPNMGEHALNRILTDATRA